MTSISTKPPLRRAARRTASESPRHLFMWLMIAFTLFPVYVVISSSLSSSGAITQSLVPSEITWFNYERLFNDDTVPFLTWMANSFTLAIANSVLSVAIGVFAAFAFSRLRYKGRKQSLQALLLIQVFPNSLALAAIYVLMERIYRVFPEIGLGTAGGLLLVYLGGSGCKRLAPQGIFRLDTD
jgi:arabinogalactan oligomer/maltooligosaccharide transport system permease protein